MVKDTLIQIRFPVGQGKMCLNTEESKTIIIDGLVITITNMGLEKKYFTLDTRNHF